MFPTIQNSTADTKTLITLEQNRCLIGVTKNLSNLSKASSTLPCSDFVESIVSFLSDKKNLHKYDNFIIQFTKYFLKTSLSKKSCIELIKNSCNLEDIVKFSDFLTHSKQIISCEHFLKKKLYLIVWEVMQWNATSNALIEEMISNTRFGSRTHAESTEVRKTQSWLNEMNSCDSKNDPIGGQMRVPALDFGDTSSDGDKKLNLLCLFADETYYDKISSDHNNMRHNSDVGMVLPMNCNVVVAYNVLTISDENNRLITIYFRHALEAKFDYKCSNSPSAKKSLFYSSMKKEDRVENGGMRKLNSSHLDAIVNQDTELFNRRNNKIICKSPKQFKGQKIESDSFLHLKGPILLNYMEQNKTKQLLMYKAHSVENISRDESKSDFGKILEELLAKSVHYDGEPIHLVFEPLKCMTRLKREEEINRLKLSYPTRCKHDLISYRIYNKLLQYKIIKMLRDMHGDSKTCRTLLQKNECGVQLKDTNEMPGKSFFLTHSNLDQRKNVSTSVNRKSFEMSDNTLSGKHTKEISDESITATDNCSDLLENVSASVTRKYFGMDKMFPENRSDLKFRRQVSRTALKKVNVRQIMSSVFRHFFHFYSLHRGNLKSGTVITRSNSNYWLQISGVATDSCTLKLAGELFATTAGKKVVLNIFDYIKFLVVFARTRRLIITELVKQMMAYEQLSEPLFNMEKCKKCSLLKDPKPTEFCYEDNRAPISRSLPNMWNTGFKNVSSKVNSCIRRRNCFSEDIF